MPAIKLSRQKKRVDELMGPLVVSGLSTLTFFWSNFMAYKWQQVASLEIERQLVGSQRRAAQSRALDHRINYLYATLQGCDWCCGGGDELVAALIKERDELG